MAVFDGVFFVFRANSGSGRFIVAAERFHTSDEPFVNRRELVLFNEINLPHTWT